MRTDIFLKLMGVFKTRSQAGKACSGGYVTSKGRGLKPSSGVAAGDTLEIVKPDGRILHLRITELPASRQVSRKDRGNYCVITEAEA